MRPCTQKQTQVKKELCRVLDDVDVDVDTEISSTFLSSFLLPKKDCKRFTYRCVFCNVALFFCSAIKLSTEPTSTIFKIKGRLASFHAKDDVAFRTIIFH